MDAAFVEAWRAICQALSGAFTQPTCTTFLQIATGWVLCRSKPTVTNLVCTIGDTLVGHAAKHWSVYERFFYRSVWSLERLSQLLFERVVVPLVDQHGRDGRGAPIELALDSTTCGRTGKHVAYAGYYKDASATNVTKAVIHWAHNWLIGAVILRPKHWPHWAVALPVFFDLYRKKPDCDRDHPFASTSQLAAHMIHRAQNALLNRRIHVVGDAAFATREVVEALSEQSSLVSRIRRDAALHAPRPRRRRRGPGRPPKWGPRLSTPEQMARRRNDWQGIRIRKGGRVVKRLALWTVCLWPRVCGDRPVKVIVVRDPRGVQNDDFFVCTDATVSSKVIAERYYARWTIEEAIQDGKQHGGFEQVHGWCPQTVVRQAPMALIVQTLVKAWYVRCGRRATSAQPKGSTICGWRRPKDHPSYLDMLATLRRVLWEDRINIKSALRGVMRKTLHALQFTLFAAA